MVYLTWLLYRSLVRDLSKTFLILNLDVLHNTLVPLLLPAQGSSCGMLDRAVHYFDLYLRLFKYKPDFWKMAGTLDG